MAEEIIGMDDMMAIYEVTDALGIDRESISVPLEKAGSGGAAVDADGAVEITVPATITTRDWLPALRSALEELGLEPSDDDDEAW
jgi:hypothetical protein